MNSPASARGMAALALLSLAIGSFGIGMTEFVMMGLLPQIATSTLPELWRTDPDRAIAQAGLLISLYALGVVVGAPTLSGLLARYPRHLVLVGLTIALAVFNGLILVVPGFGGIAVTRFLAGLPHGAYFGFAALVAADIMGPARRAQGVAFALTGLTVANIVGVPIGTFAGQRWGWQAAFAIVTAVFVLAAILIALFVPAHAGDPGRRFRQELRVFRIGQVWVTVAIGAIGFAGFFALYSYIAPLVTEVAHADAAVVPAVLMTMGIGMALGNLLGGRLADGNLSRTLLGSFIAVMITLALLALTAQWIVALFVFVLLVGIASSIGIPALQTRLMDVAHEYQAIGAALNHSAMNIGNSLGAFLGGAVIAFGWGFRAPAWVGVTLAGVGFLIAAASFAASRRVRA